MYHYTIELHDPFACESGLNNLEIGYQNRVKYTKKLNIIIVILIFI